MLLAAAWSLAVLVAAGIGLSAFFSHETIERFDSSLSEDMFGLVAGASVEGGQITPPPFADPRSLRAYSGDYWEIGTLNAGAFAPAVRSRSLWDRSITPPPRVMSLIAKTPGKIIYFDAPGPLRQSLRVAAMQGRLPDFNPPVVFLTADDRSPVNRAVRVFAEAIALSLALLGAGLVAAVIVQVRVGLRPLFALQREVAAVRTGKGERIVGRYPSELSPLADELNALMAHTQEVVERQRTHVGNLAHALKTPLSVIANEAAQQPGPLSEVVTRQTQSMSQHIDHHLRRARAAARASGGGERTQVAPLLDDLARTLEKIFRDRVSRIDWSCPDDLAFAGERQDLLEIAGNVMENACKYSAGRVDVQARADGRELVLSVEDDGPGLAPEVRSAMLRRGARLDERTPGSGLGLSIVDDLSRAYGGSTVLGSSDLGGLKIIVRLPRAEG